MESRAIVFVFVVPSGPPVKRGRHTCKNYLRRRHSFSIGRDGTVVELHSRKIQQMGGWSCFVALFKATVGSGVMFVPRGYSNAGWATATFVYALFAALSVLGTWQVLDCSKKSPVQEAVTEDPSKERSIENDSQQDSSNTSAVVGQSSGEKRTESQGQNSNTVTLSYTDVARAAYGPAFAKFVHSAIVIAPICFCTVYLVFIAGSVTSVFPGLRFHLPTTFAELFGTSPHRPIYIPKDHLEGYVIFFLGILFIPIMCRKDLVSGLGIFNEIGSFTILFGCGVVIGFCTYTIYYLQSGRITHEAEPFNENWPLFVGTAAYTFEGVPNYVPIAQAMKPEEVHGKKFISILSGMYVFVVVLFFAIGYSCYGVYGPYVDVLALNSLPQNLLTTSAKLIYCLGLVFTYPLLLSVVPLQVEPWLMRKAEECVGYGNRQEGKGETFNPWCSVSTFERQQARKGLDDSLFSPERESDVPETQTEAEDSPSRFISLSEDYQARIRKRTWFSEVVIVFFRTFLVLLTVFLAIYLSGPSFGHFVELVGSVLCSPLMIAIPAALHLKLKADGNAFWRVCDLLLIWFGTAVSVLGTVFTVMAWWEDGIQ